MAGALGLLRKIKPDFYQFYVRATKFCFHQHLKIKGKGYRVHTLAWHYKSTQNSILWYKYAYRKVYDQHLFVNELLKGYWLPPLLILYFVFD